MSNVVTSQSRFGSVVFADGAASGSGAGCLLPVGSHAQTRTPTPTVLLLLNFFALLLHGRHTRQKLKPRTRQALPRHGSLTQYT